MGPPNPSVRPFAESSHKHRPGHPYPPYHTGKHWHSGRPTVRPPIVGQRNFMGPAYLPRLPAKSSHKESPKPKPKPPEPPAPRSTSSNPSYTWLSYTWHIDIVAIYRHHSYDNPILDRIWPRTSECREVMIKLPDDVLLNIFRHYMLASESPQVWTTLTHVCRRWRQIILTSPLGLRLRLCCTYGTPVLKGLDFWPPFPLVVNYRGSPMLDPPDPEDEENIMAALTQFDRVNSISLTLTNSLLGRLSTIADPFSILQELVLLSRDNVQLTLPNTFSWGLRLRTLHLTRITIPTLLQLLSPSTSLVDLQLHEIHNVGYLSPDAFVNALSEMTQLETLSLHFLTLPPRRNYLDFPPQSRERVVLPALTCLKYRGTSKYLDRLVARIDAPHLRDIGITFFNQPTMDASQLGRFIERTEIQSLLSRADIQTSAHDISICCSKLEAHSPAQLGLRILCGQSDWQLSLMTQICNHFSTFLSRVIVLGIHLTQSPSETDDVYGEQWPDLIRAFGGAEDFHVAGPHATDMLSALCTADGHATDTTTLPALCNLHISDKPGPLWDAAQSFIASRRLSGRPVEVNPSFRPRSVGGGCTLM